MPRRLGEIERGAGLCRPRIIKRMSGFTEGESIESRRGWPVRLYRLGEEPGDDQSQINTAEQRLAMMWDLALEAWSLTGRPVPEYARHETPVRCRPWGVAQASRA